MIIFCCRVPCEDNCAASWDGAFTYMQLGRITRQLMSWSFGTLLNTNTLKVGLTSLEGLSVGLVLLVVGLWIRGTIGLSSG